MERLETATNLPKKRNKSKDLKKSKTKPAAPYENVKSRLLQSIESSRQKSNQKYFNPDRMRHFANKENEDSKSIHQSNSKYAGDS
jgi:hypothetical protein